MLQLHAVESGYGMGQVLFGVSLSIAPGACVSLMGRNGMGKTTTVRTIMGQLPLIGGQIHRFGDDRPDIMPFEIARAGIGLVPEGRQVFSNLTVAENLQTFFRPPHDKRQSHWHFDRVLTLFPRLAERVSHLGNHLSGGEQQMLAIGRSLVINPSVIMLDEPSQGLAPMIVEDVKEMLLKLKKEGMSIILVEQNLQTALDVADRVYILDQGEIVFEGKSQELSKNKKLTLKFLGVST